MSMLLEVKISSEIYTKTAPILFFDEDIPLAGNLSIRNGCTIRTGSLSDLAKSCRGYMYFQIIANGGKRYVFI